MFTWNEIVSLYLIRFLHDPEIVLYLMKILSPLRRQVILDEAREWHSSLRVSYEDRIKMIYKEKKHKLNIIPYGSDNITVPFYSREFHRASENLMYSIHCFRADFIRLKRESGVDEDGNIEEIDVKAKIYEKKYIVDLLFNENNISSNKNILFWEHDIYYLLRDYIDEIEEGTHPNIATPFIYHYYNEKNVESINIEY